jgi:N-acetylneuraminate synthase/N,N'-diacetyllegionaminate synthase
MAAALTSTRFAPSFEIAGRKVGGEAPCYVIAEAGVAHFGSVNKAYALVDLAVDAKADAVKFQHFRSERLFGPSAPDWRSRMRSRELSDDDMLGTAEYARKRGITFICTGHDEPALDFLDHAVGVPAFKIGSGEVENWPFIADIARRGKPVILSTGMYSLELIKKALEVLGENGCSKVAVLHCVTSYPADPSTINLDVMRQIREFFDGPVGYSDHTAGTAVPLAAVALGAAVLEKHITLDFNVPDAQDWKVSCGPDDLAKFIAEVRAVTAARGGGPRSLSENEQKSLLWARKSLTAARDIAAGECIEPAMLLSQRPGDGVPPSQLASLLGRRARCGIAAGTKIALDMLESR